MSIASEIRKIRASEYVRDSLVNIFGILFGAVFPLAVTPILSRIYSPEEFGIFGLFTALLSMVSVIGGGKYEVAIVIPKDKSQALEIAAAAASVSLGLSLIFGGVVGLVGSRLAEMTGVPVGAIWLSPLAFLTTVQFQVLLNCAIRDRLFSRTSLARAVVSLSSAVLMLAMGLGGFGAFGLILATILAQLVGAFVLLYFVARSYADVSSQVTWKGVKSQFVRFKDYPKYAVVSDFANTLALRLPVLVFASAFSPAAVGYLTMFQRVWAGSSILGSGIGETFRQKAARDYASSGNFRRTYVATFWLMASIAGIAWLVLVTLGPWLFATLLGTQWHEAGVYGQILATLVCIQFVASPLGWAVYIVERLRYNMIWQWSLLLLYSVAFYVGILLGDEQQTLLLYAATGSFMYLVYLVISYQMAKGRQLATDAEK